MPEHDIHDFLKSSQQVIENEYKRIRKRAGEDPGTAGDQGEEDWATLLKNWLPSYLHVVTKGRILTASGDASPQVDVLVLHPGYPKILQDKKLYLAGGVLAAFECKTTLKASHVEKTVRTAAGLRRNLPTESGSPRKELFSPILFGLLAHSHCWQQEGSRPVEKIDQALWEADSKHVQHPRECLDTLCVADLATWQVMKTTYMSPNLDNYKDTLEHIYGERGSASSSYGCAAIEGPCQAEHFSPLGVLLTGLFHRLAWTFEDMRGLDSDFRKANAMGSGRSKRLRPWPLEVYSEGIRERVFEGRLSNCLTYDEWQMAFLA